MLRCLILKEKSIKIGVPDNLIEFMNNGGQDGSKHSEIFNVEGGIELNYMK